MEGVGAAWVGYGPCPRRGSWAGQGEFWRRQGFGNGADARVDGATATAAATAMMEAKARIVPLDVGEEVGGRGRAGLESREGSW